MTKEEARAIEEMLIVKKYREADPRTQWAVMHYLRGTATTGEVLRALRGDLPAGEVAAAVGIDEEALEDIELDLEIPGRDILERIAEYYGIPVQAIP